MDPVKWIPYRSVQSRGFSHSAIGSFGQLANYITRRTTANGQLTLGTFGRRTQHDGA